MTTDDDRLKTNRESWDWRNSYNAFQYHASEMFYRYLHMPEFYHMTSLTYDSKQFVFKSEILRRTFIIQTFLITFST